MVELQLSGGDFFKEGSFSCVYKNPLVDCVPGTLQGYDSSYDPNDKTLVSRIVPKDDQDEFVNQEEVRRIINVLDQKYQGLRFKDHFNVAVATCTPRITQRDIYPDKCSLYPDLNSIGDKFKYINFITKLQGEDLGKNVSVPNAKIYFRKAFFDVMNATVALNSEGFIHFDMHPGNIGWSTHPWPQKTLVIFDWGSSIFGYKKFIDYIILANLFKGEYAKSRPQFDFQREILIKIIGNESLPVGNDSLKIVAERQNKDTVYLTSLEKLFYAWDTYSLLYQMAKIKYPGLEDFTEDSLKLYGDKFTTKNISGKTALKLVDDLILTTRIKKNDKRVWVQELWNIIAYVFKERPIYRRGLTYVTSFSGHGLKRSDEMIAEELFHPDAGSRRRSKSRSSKSRSRSKSRSIIDLISMSRSPQSVIDLISMSRSSIKKKKSKGKKSPCPQRKVRDVKTRRCRERKKPGPKSRK
jgi:hypothetical protein